MPVRLCESRTWFTLACHVEAENETVKLEASPGSNDFLVMPKATPIVFMFSGQGSQTYQMGRELYDTQPVFRAWMQRLDKVAATNLGISLIDRLYCAGADRLTPFDRLVETHPALYMVQFSLAKAVEDAGIRADMVLGTSLGEWVAMTLAGAMPPEDALVLIIEVARLIERQALEGRMMAVLEQTGLFHQRQDLFQGVELAGTNYDRHFLVAGPTEAVDASAGRLFKAGINHQVLNVRYAFHSSWIDDPMPAFQSLFSSVAFQAPRIPVISCTTTDVCRTVTPDYLWSTIRLPIEFSTTLERLEKRQNSCLVDLGTSGTLRALARQKLAPQSGSEVHGVMDFFGRDREGFERLLQSLEYLCEASFPFG